MNYGYGPLAPSVYVQPGTGYHAAPAGIVCQVLDGALL